MFADRETMERRAEAAAAEWGKAKAVWRKLGRWLAVLAILLGLIFAYAAGDLNARLNCLGLRPEVTSTP